MNSKRGHVLCFLFLARLDADVFAEQIIAEAKQNVERDRVHERDRENANRFKRSKEDSFKRRRSVSPPNQRRRSHSKSPPPRQTDQKESYQYASDSDFSSGSE